jgi:hypothetical protein
MHLIFNVRTGVIYRISLGKAAMHESEMRAHRQFSGVVDSRTYYALPAQKNPDLRSRGLEVSSWAMTGAWRGRTIAPDIMEPSNVEDI